MFCQKLFGLFEKYISSLLSFCRRLIGRKWRRTCDCRSSNRTICWTWCVRWASSPIRWFWTRSSSSETQLPCRIDQLAHFCSSRTSTWRRRSSAPRYRLKHYGVICRDDFLQLVEGTPKNSWKLMSGDSVTDNKSIYTFHDMNIAGSSIMVKLGAVYLLNRVQLHLWDGDQRYYCYYVEVKMRHL